MKYVILQVLQNNYGFFKKHLQNKTYFVPYYKLYCSRVLDYVLLLVKVDKYMYNLIQCLISFEYE